MVVLISDTTILPWALYVERFVERFVEPPALFSRENRGALYVERFVERFVEHLYSTRTATELNRSGLYSAQQGLFVERFCRALLGAPSAKMQS